MSGAGVAQHPTGRVTAWQRRVAAVLRRPRLNGLQAFALAFCLLFAQQHASLHWLGHALDAVAQADAQAADQAHGQTSATAAADGHGTPVSPVSQTPCEDCTAIASLDALPTSTVLPVALAGPVAAPTSVDVAVHRPPLRLAYRSRAPPFTA